MKHLSGVEKTSWSNYELSLHAKFSLRCYYVLISARICVFMCVFCPLKAASKQDSLRPTENILFLSK